MYVSSGVIVLGVGLRKNGAKNVSNIFSIIIYLIIYKNRTKIIPRII